MSLQQQKYSIVAALNLRGMKVLKLGKGIGDKVITIERPSRDFRRKAVQITESLFGKRQQFYAIRFNGFTIRWDVRD